MDFQEHQVSKWRIYTLYPDLSSSGSYSLAKSTVLKGTESRFRYQNPHVDFVVL